MTITDPTERQSLRDQYNATTILKQAITDEGIILFLTPILLMIWVYHGKQGSFDHIFGFVGHWQDFYSALYEWFSAFLLMFWVPYFVIRVVFKKRLRDFGLRLGDVRSGVRIVLILAPFMIWMSYVGSGGVDMQAEYPLAKSTMEYLPMFILAEASYLLYYVGWEFFFRGFMLFGLEEKFGAAIAILIQTIPSVIIHIGKPGNETFAAIGAGLIGGYVAMRTRSIYYPLLLHILVGICTDVFVTLRVM
ncbi:MAG: CPBP family intramembrane metalloprotease [Anaerolineae bacterium]|nr:CPBP family intramembrane metalloprotease [Anaerolineae bacterium]